MSNSVKIRPLIAEFFHAGVRTDRERTKLIAGSRNSANAPVIRIVIIDPNHIVICCCLNARVKPKFLAEACVIDCGSSAAETLSDILTHSTDCEAC